MLAMECAVAWATEAKRFPGINSLLRGLILDGTFCDAKTYITTQWRDRLGTYPTFTQNLLKRLTQEERFECKAYKALEQSLTDVFTVRVIPHPLCYEESDKGCNEAIYVQMQGASEFCCGGVLANWTIKERLHVVQVPTLVVRGEYDTMTEEVSSL
jgi:L-proline amide hydrolase